MSFNLHGPGNRQLPRLIELFDTHPELSAANVLAFQEVNRHRPRFGNHDIATLLAAELGKHFVYATEHVYGEGRGERGLAVLSDFPLSDAQRLELPVEGPGGRRRIALSANVQLGSVRLRIVNVHLETRITPKARRIQMQGLLSDGHTDGMATIVLGDFNTFTRRHTRTMADLLEGRGFYTPMSGDAATFRRFALLRLKLDWIWLRGMPSLASRVETKIKVSDHRPVWVDVDLSGISN